METLIARLKEIASLNPEGFTVLYPSLEYATSGYVVALAETQDSFGDEGLNKVISFNTGYVGGWLEKGQFYWDAVEIFTDRDEAIKAGRERKQIAIYHLDTDKPITL